MPAAHPLERAPADVTGAVVTVVVVTWQGAHLLGPCLDSLARQTGAARGASWSTTPRPTTPRSCSPRTRRCGSSAPSGTSASPEGAQRGLEAATDEWVAFLNNDAVAEPGWLAALLHAGRADPGSGAVTSLLLLAGTDPPRVNNAGVVLLPTLYGADRAAGAARRCRAGRGVRIQRRGGAAARAAAVGVGGFPERFFLYYEDTDLSWRLRLAGWSIRYEPGAVVHHRHAATSDVSSALFAFHNERNRLLVLVRCAPAPDVTRAWVRFAVTTASLTARRLRAGRPAQPYNLRVGLRLRVLRSALRLLPWAVRARVRIRAGDPQTWIGPSAADRSDGFVGRRGAGGARGPLGGPGDASVVGRGPVRTTRSHPPACAR